jgi:4-hydroxyphenylacetate 3-monooxygenase
LSTANRETKNDVRPFTGEQYLESLRDGREVWIYGERVKDVTTHPAFRNAARMIARLYDALHDPQQQPALTIATDTGNGGFTHRFFRVDRNAEELLKTRDAIAQWARITYGWMGRSPDYKASFLGTLGANSAYYKPFESNASEWYRRAQERCLFMNHAIVNPPIDRSRPPDEVADVYVRVEKETDAGLIASGAKVVATGSALTNYNFIGYNGVTPLGRPDMALFAMIPMDSPGVKLICRTSYEMTAETMGSPFDYPLSSRFDENDAIFILDKVLIPWENVFVYRDLERANHFFPKSGFVARFAIQGCTRLAVKLDFIMGVLLKAAEATGQDTVKSSQVSLGEIMAWRTMFWALSDAMARACEPWVGDTILPNTMYASCYRVLGAVAYPRIRQLIEQTYSSALIYLNSHAADFKSPELRPLLDRYIRGSAGYDSVERVKILKLLWDSIGTEFGSRHELYEMNYAGNHDTTRFENLMLSIDLGKAAEVKELAERCLAEYDLDGWRAKDLLNATDINRIMTEAKRK